MVREVIKSCILKYGKGEEDKVTWMIIEPSGELLQELDSHMQGSSKNISDLIRETLESYFRQHPLIRPGGEISGRPEIRRTIQFQDDMRRLLEGSSFSTSETIRKIRDGG
ncbi:hypothetical protein E0L93_11985 [Rubrobacter taiwanensis]|jgi:hypothetical protein|uniref:Ribbon-helix-helix protein, CopG family n=1 Tax=Rubrobacter taiwanensis TaxID=185139 RepID=A0A4R1BF39_9ACTN|nr:hypothetical protein [Rubrobacter taiwanensis]TCJ15714.1 hypothetical protein E0L93_11985 [Rubrobacter taiwanensis]